MTKNIPNKIKRKRLATRKDRILTIANCISISRIILSIPLIYFLTSNEIAISLGIILLIIFTDLIDGWVARKVDEITHFGKLIDPLADKVCIMVVVIFLIYKIGLPMLIFFFLLAIRDIIIITLGVYLMLKQDRVFDSNLPGKWFVFTASLMMLSFILDYNFIAYGFYTISIILFCISTYYYIKRYIRIFKELYKTDALHF